MILKFLSEPEQRIKNEIPRYVGIFYRFRCQLALYCSIYRQIFVSNKIKNTWKVWSQIVRQLVFLIEVPSSHCSFVLSMIYYLESLLELESQAQPFAPSIAETNSQQLPPSAAAVIYFFFSNITQGRQESNVQDAQLHQADFERLCQQVKAFPTFLKPLRFLKYDVLSQLFLDVARTKNYPPQRLTCRTFNFR